MTKRRADYPCVLPGDPAWIDDARYVQEILDCLAAAAAVAHDYKTPRSTSWRTFRIKSRQTPSTGSSPTCRPRATAPCS
ncbi:hypothetical protein [Streptomyces chrestomyceticus]|uniref:hypothetical protein n=1 Tax=Streptomyces chrestomyceticus TaxID=68185 RepID=UPI0035A902AE